MTMEDRRVKLTGNQNVDLPAEIIDEILSRLPVKPLCRFKCVSKSWRSLISDPDFIAMHSSKAFEIKDVLSQRLKLLFTDRESDCVYSLDVGQLLNHNHNVEVDGLVATSAELDFVFDNLPRRGRYNCTGLVHTCNSFLFFQITDPIETNNGFVHNHLITNPATRELKKVYNIHDNICGIVFSVYTLETSSWRRVEGEFLYFPISIGGIVLNGHVHWLAVFEAKQDPSLLIISFNLAKEEVREIPLPPIRREYSSRLGVFRNWLCITLEPGGCKSTEFWVMKEYGVRESWTKMQVSKPYQELSHSGFWTESHDLMVFDKSSLVMYNFNDGTFWNLSIGDITTADGYFGSFGIYVESLASNASLKNMREVEKIDESTQWHP
ncbi:F-box/kelch-repeat protein At3g06240-like [Rosa rugosa]|uniref:F-box/kelch-repeat protein At3g06240-like n=1 Tax=Rosa rugosa TaxID=74645 RepID=UPI002B40328B|nr:F-box/kelch-repeat protein At3g06240-like [Rosa rugosa]